MTGLFSGQRRRRRRSHVSDGMRRRHDDDADADAGSGAVCEMCGSHGASLCIGRLGSAAAFLCSTCMEAADD